ncbi:MAG: hypothetical protein QNI91_04750 [Arenicellales bacterium]|nr:hypothetical protein [Arenicellales bacterium]
MTQFNDLYDRMIRAMGVEDLNISTAGVKFYRHGGDIPDVAVTLQIALRLTQKIC